MPHIAFIFLAACLGGLGYMLKDAQLYKADELSEEEVAANEAAAAAAREPASTELSWDDVNPVDVISLEVGYRLILLLIMLKEGFYSRELKAYVKKSRKNWVFLIPTVHIRDNLDLKPNFYRISLAGVVMGRTLSTLTNGWPSIPGQVFGTIEGIQGKDPAFGMDAVWINESQKNRRIL